MKTANLPGKYPLPETYRYEKDREQRGERKAVTVRLARNGNGPEPDEGAYFIQVEGYRLPSGLFVACDPFTPPERVRKKINQYARIFLRRCGRRFDP